MEWKAITPDRKDWLYSCREEADKERRCIGHLRGDFGRSGTEFWTSWFDHQTELKNKAFRDELQDVVNELREAGHILNSFSSMAKGCRAGLPMDGCYGFEAETDRTIYCLRCIPRRGDYNFYLYCYAREEKENDVGEN